MKKYDEIIGKLNYVLRKLSTIEAVSCGKAAALERALGRVEKERDELIEERDKLRAENQRLDHSVYTYFHRLQHLLQSQTISLFDEKDSEGNYVRDIKRLDTDFAPLQEGDALMAPNHQIITFPGGDTIKVAKPDEGYYLIKRDGLDFVYPDGSVLKVR